MKVLHPETVPNHSYGLELENETDVKDYTLHGYSADGSQFDGSQQHHQYETIENQGEFDGGSYGSASEAKELSHHQFQVNIFFRFFKTEKKTRSIFANFIRKNSLL